MKAIILKDAKSGLKLEEASDPALKAGEALVELKAAALNHRDLWITKGLYPGIKYPIILGSDGAGVVTQCAPDVNKNWMDQEVIINPGFSWGNDPKASGKDFKILGLPDNGTLAQKVAVPASQLVPKPKHLSFTQAAALPLAGLTAFRALFVRAKLETHEMILITGAGGGVALFALQFAVANKNKIYVTSGSKEKIAQAMKLGAQGGVNYHDKDWADQLSKQVPDGFQVILDSAGGSGFNNLIDVAAPGGRIVFYGATKENPTELNMRKVFWKQLNLLGSTMGSPDNFAAMLDFVQKHQIVPVVHSTHPLAEAEKAFQLMEKSGQFGKIVVTI